jgi:membrane-bound metal-dependent hydrolase YbcI (DUF457 family)
MANFRTHIGVSTAAGIVYGLAGYKWGMPWETCIIAGGLCSVSGMLPDLDSDSGIPLREAVGFCAAFVPMLMVDRLQRFGCSHEMMVLIAGVIYVFIRFGMAEFFRRYTVHRGMWHSIPAALSCGMFAFLVVSCEDMSIRLYKTIAIVLGFMSHLILDEIWSVDYKRGGYVFKSSFGSALKFWGPSAQANMISYLLVVALGTMVYFDPGFMERFGPPRSDVPHTAWQVIQSLWDGTKAQLTR